MKKYVDEVIVLRRVNYGERDRVVTALARDSGKITLFVKGARAQKSRLSGGIELLNINEIGFMDGKSGMRTLTSSRIVVANQSIVTDINRTNLIFENYKLLNKIIEDDHGQELYEIVKTYLLFMNDLGFNYVWSEVWFRLKLLQILGLVSELKADDSGAESYNFDWEDQTFMAREEGTFSRNDIKFLRLQSMADKPAKLTKDLGTEESILNFTRLLLENNLN